MRPKSIERFEALFLVSLGIGIVTSALNWDFLSQSAGVGFTLAVQAGTLLIMLTLVLLVSRRRSNISRWILMILFVIGSIAFIPGTAELFAQSPITAILAAIQIAMQVTAFYFAFRPDSKPWFTKTVS